MADLVQRVRPLDRPDQAAPALAEQTPESGRILEGLASPILLALRSFSDLCDFERLKSPRVGNECVKSLELLEVIWMKNHRLVLSIPGHMHRDPAARTW
jgi:hypothetical protein